MDEPTHSSLPRITSADAEAQLQDKMHDLALRKKEEQTAARAASLGIPYINLKGFPISPETISVLTEQQSQDYHAVSFFLGADSLRIGTTDPDNVELQALIKKITEQYHATATLYLISEHSLELALRLYGTLPKLRKFVSGVELTADDLHRFDNAVTSFKDLQEKIQKTSITDVVTLVIAAAIKSRSSDIHIEAEENDVKVRFRIDGILQDAASLEKAVWPQIITRVKLLAKLKINITDRPQDGRFTIFLTGDKIDVRVSALPTAYGESVVMRLLMSSSVGISFDQLGLRDQAYKILAAEIEKPNGMIVTTGPTGSGKTTTLYAILNKLNEPGTKIITIEDPVEYKLQGINQSQIDHSKGYGFADGLRSILRQDPDIIMVGEIRDLETADVAINASLTGHLVITTLHTNDASGTIPRFLAMEVKPFLLAPAINAMIGQRLVRRICEHCKKETKLPLKQLNKVVAILSDIPESAGIDIHRTQLQANRFYIGNGCTECQGLGYKGRVGIYEIVTMNPEIEKFIMSGHVSEYDMRALAAKNGMITMIQDGLLKALEGMTTVEEVFRVAKDISAKSV